jgi:cytochrome c oxidase subunit 1
VTLTNVSAAGGLLLFVSALFFLLVTLFTVVGRERDDSQAIEFAASLNARQAHPTVFDRVGLWTMAAIVLVAIAYGPPIWNHLHLLRYGSPGFSPF